MWVPQGAASVHACTHACMPACMHELPGWAGPACVLPPTHLRPLLGRLVEDALVAKDQNLKLAPGRHPLQDLIHGLAARLLVHCAHAHFDFGQVGRACIAPRIAEEAFPQAPHPANRRVAPAAERCVAVLCAEKGARGARGEGRAGRAPAWVQRMPIGLPAACLPHDGEACQGWKLMHMLQSRATHGLQRLNSRSRARLRSCSCSPGLRRTAQAWVHTHASVPPYRRRW